MVSKIVNIFLLLKLLLFPPLLIGGLDDGCLDGCLSVIKLFSNCYSYSFCPILTKVGTHDQCANTKKCEKSFLNFALKIFCRI